MKTAVIRIIGADNKPKDFTIVSFSMVEPSTMCCRFLTADLQPLQSQGNLVQVHHRRRGRDFRRLRRVRGASPSRSRNPPRTFRTRTRCARRIGGRGSIEPCCVSPPKPFWLSAPFAKTAAECSCSCDAGGRGKGYLGHDKGCWVHLDREDYKAVYRFIDSAKKRNS